MTVKRGEIYFADLGGGYVGSEQNGLRPVIILQNNRGNQHSSTTIVITITTKAKKRLPTHVPLKSDINTGLKSESVALCEQIRTIDKKRLDNRIGTVDENTLNKITKAVQISLAMQ
jgi:mRNA interferase MazF